MNPATPRSLSREYNLDALQAAGVSLPADTLRLMGAGASVNSVTVDNASNAIIGIFLDRDPRGQPSFIVAPATFKTQPCGAVLIGVGIQAPSGDIARGTCYVQISDQTLSASSGVSTAASASAVWDSSTFDSGAKMGG